MRLRQRDLYRQLRDQQTATRDRIANLVRPLDSAKLSEHPEPNGWSVGQVLEHLCKADELYAPRLTKLLASTAPDAGAAAREWKSSFIGGRIAVSLENPKAIKRGPGAFRPGPTPRNGVVQAFIDGETRFLERMDDALPYDWRALRIKTPALPNWAPSINVGDGFRIHVVHIARHARQVERLVQKL